MKKFRFRLETLLALRLRREEAIKLELGAKMRELESARRSLETLHRSFADLQAAEKQRRGSLTGAQELRFSAAWRFRLRRQIAQQEHLIATLEGEAAAIRNRLVEARRQRRAIEIVRERKFEAWKEEYAKAEQNFMDEIGTRR